MSRRSGWILGGVCVLLAGWLGLWLTQNFERSVQRVSGEPSAEARRNPYLAAERFLRRLGLEVASQGSREWLQTPPEQPGLLLVRDLGWDLTAAQVDALETWMQGGGHLVVTPPGGAWGAEAEPNPLLERFGVRLEAPQGDDAAGARPPAGGLYRIDGLAPGPVEVWLGDGPVLFDPAEKAQWRAAPAGAGFRWLRFRQGRGGLTVLTDQDWLRNQEIGDHDHAFLLAELAAGAERAWLLYRPAAPPLTRLLWQWAPELVLSVLLLIPLWLWFLTQRSGPLIHRGDPPRRNLLENLEAGARYTWRQDRGRSLVQASQRRIEQQWRRRHASLERKTPAERSQWIARLLDIEPRAVHRALYEPVRNEQEFIRVTAALRRLSRGLREARRG